MINLATTTRTSFQIHEVAAYYNVTRQTIYNWIRWKWLPAVRPEHGGMRISIDVLRRIDRADPDFVKVVDRVLT